MANFITNSIEDRPPAGHAGEKTRKNKKKKRDKNEKQRE